MGVLTTLKTFKEKDLIYMEGIDWSMSTVWQNVEEAKRELPCIIKQVGFYLNHDKEVIRWAHALIDPQNGENLQVKGHIMALKSITKVKKL